MLSSLNDESKHFMNCLTSVLSEEDYIKEIASGYLFFFTCNSKLKTQKTVVCFTSLTVIERCSVILQFRNSRVDASCSVT